MIEFKAHQPRRNRRSDYQRGGAHACGKVHSSSGNGHKPHPPGRKPKDREHLAARPDQTAEREREVESAVRKVGCWRTWNCRRAPRSSFQQLELACFRTQRTKLGTDPCPLAIPAELGPSNNINGLRQVRHQNESTETKRFPNKCLTSIVWSRAALPHNRPRWRAAA